VARNALLGLALLSVLTLAGCSGASEDAVAADAKADAKVAALRAHNDSLRKARQQAAVAAAPSDSAAQATLA